MYGAGIIISGFSASLYTLYFFFGILGGFGTGTVYGCALTNAIKWFPDRRGLASGLAAAGLGMGAVVFAPVASYFIQLYDVVTTFKILGAIFFTVIVGLGAAVKEPPAGYKPAGWEPSPVMAASVSQVDKNWREMLADPMFYVLWVMYISGALSGLMIMGHAATIAQEVVKLTLPVAVLSVTILALANTFGRIFWGYISDNIGRYSALIGIFSCCAVMMLVIASTNAFLAFVLTLSVIGLCFGGLLGIFPAITGEMFGVKYLGVNYGIMFTAFAVAGIIGPRLAAVVKELHNDYTVAFQVAAAMSVCGLMLAIYTKSRISKRNAQITVSD